MPVYRIRLRASSAPLRALYLLEKFGTVLGYETESDGDLTAEMIEADLASEALAELPDGRGRPAGERFGRTWQEIAERDAEIARLYQEDPRANSSEKLAQRYGISRERVCQVLRRNNIIEHVGERRRAAKEALQEETAAIRAQVKADFDAKVERALEKIKGGMSVRSAAHEVGFEKHSPTTLLLGRLCKQRGIKIVTGRWRDFSERKERIRKMVVDEGKTIAEACRILRAEGDARLHVQWIYNNMPDLPVRGKPVQEEDQR